MICKPGQEGLREVKLKNTINASKGDKVLLESSDKEHIKLTFMQYGLPLLGFLIGLFIPYQFLDKFPFSLSRELGSFLTGLIVLGITSFLTYFWCQKKNQSGFSVLQLRKVLTDSDKI